MWSTGPLTKLDQISVVITVLPNMPSIPSNTALGTTVAVIYVCNSDGSAFTGTLGFGPPNFDDGGVFALSGSSNPYTLIVNPSGPGVGPDGGTVQNVSLVAVE